MAFAEAGTNAFTTVAVIYSGEKIGLSSSQIGIFFAVSLFGTIPGSRIGAADYCPDQSQELFDTLSESLCCRQCCGGNFLSDETQLGSYLWGFAVGFMLGWHYPVEVTCCSFCCIMIVCNLLTCVLIIE